MDMRFDWTRDRVARGEFSIKWGPREKNIADFFTKDLSTKEFLEVRNCIMPGSSVRGNTKTLVRQRVSTNERKK